MVVRAAQKSGWENIVMWKMDLKGAFTLLYIKPSDAPLLCFELTDSLTVLHHTGMFGYTGMPGCFDVISRVLNRNLQPLIKGETETYVDDVIGVSHKDDVDHDIHQGSTLFEGLLGPIAVAHEKTEKGRTIDVIGWNINLDTKKIGIAKKNMLKTLHGLVELDETKPVTLKELQKVASWAARYSMICRQLKPYTRTLFKGIRGYTNNHQRIKLNPEAQVTLRLWKCFFVMLEISPDRFTRDILSFVSAQPTYTIEYDASLTGIGVIIYKIEPDQTEVEWKVIQHNFSFDLKGESRYQNTVEFIALVVGVAALGSLGVQDVAVRCRGDNRSSLSWGIDENYRSDLGRKAALMFTTLGIQSNIRIDEAIHIAGITNIRCDQLSRNYKTPIELGFSHDQFISSKAISSVCDFCNPTVTDIDDECLQRTWNELRILSAGIFSLKQKF